MSDCATPWMAAHQAPLSLGFSRQEHWSGLLFPSPMRESEVAQSCQTLSDPMDCSPPGSSVHGIFQARVLEWGAIAFSILFTQKAENLPTLGILFVQGKHYGKDSIFEIEKGRKNLTIIKVSHYGKSLSN